MQSERDLAFGLAQGRRDRRPPRGGPDQRERRHRGGHGPVGTIGGESDQRRGLAQSEVAQIGTVAADAAQHRGGIGTHGETGLGAAQSDQPLQQPLGGFGVERRGPCRLGRRCHQCLNSTEDQHRIAGYGQRPGGSAGTGRAGLTPAICWRARPGLALVFNTYRSGDGEMTVDADLGQSVLSLARWPEETGGMPPLSGAADFVEGQVDRH